jgi:YbgC/YbaW family acyl-CoA thioester hydrolase
MIHRYRMRIPFGDTDHAGLVYYPHVFHYFHLAYEDFFHEVLKIPFDSFFTERGVGAPIVHCEIDFKGPMRHGEIIEVAASIARMSERSWTWQFEIARPSDPAPRKLLALGTITKVFVNMQTMRAIPMEPDVRAKVERLLGQDS